jgi:hypothetical protein
MRQEAPYPDELEKLVSQFRYRPGWAFKLADIDRGQGSKGLTVIITTRGYDSYHPDRGDTYRVNHYMIVPAAGYDRRSWENWLFEQCQLVEKHECMEFFVIAGERPKAPAHGPGNDPYLVLTHGDETDRRTRFTGELSPE